MHPSKTFFALGTFALLTSSYADQSAAPQPTKIDSSHREVFLSHPAYSFLVSFQALALKPSASNLHYSVQADPLPLPSPNWRVHEVHPEYHFGFDVGLREEFHHINSCLTLDWEHFDSLDSNRAYLPSEEMIGPFFEIGPDASAYTKAKGHGFFRFNEVDLDYRIHVNFGDRLKTELFAGVSFVKIRQITHALFSDVSGSNIRAIKVPSLFWGVGPQVGFEFCYRIVKGFQWVGKGKASLYAGRMKNHTNYKSATPALIPLGIMPPNEQRVDVSNRSQVVPGFEGRLGAAYAYSFCKHYMFKVEIGYQAQIYLNAIQSTDIGSQVIIPPVPQNTVGVYARTFQRTLSNFALAGPYATIDFAF
jgi:hypothetical protein